MSEHPDYNPDHHEPSVPVDWTARAREIADAWLDWQEDDPDEYSGHMLRLRPLRSRLGVGLLPTDIERLRAAFAALAAEAYQAGQRDRLPEPDCEADIKNLVAQLNAVGHALTDTDQVGWNGANLSAGVRDLCVRVAEAYREGQGNLEMAEASAFNLGMAKGHAAGVAEERARWEAHMANFGTRPSAGRGE